MPSRAYCAVDGCTNQKSMKEISFFKLPVDDKRRQKWLEMIGRPDLQQRAYLKPQCHFVCSIHFEDRMMINKPILRPNAIPTKFIPTTPDVKEGQAEIRYIDKGSQTKSSLLKELGYAADVAKTEMSISQAYTSSLKTSNVTQNTTNSLLKEIGCSKVTVKKEICNNQLTTASRKKNTQKKNKWIKRGEQTLGKKIADLSSELRVIIQKSQSQSQNTAILIKQEVDHENTGGIGVNVKIKKEVSDNAVKKEVKVEDTKNSFEELRCAEEIVKKDACEDSQDNKSALKRKVSENIIEDKTLIKRRKTMEKKLAYLRRKLDMMKTRKPHKKTVESTTTKKKAKHTRNTGNDVVNVKIKKEELKNVVKGESQIVVKKEKKVKEEILSD